MRREKVKNVFWMSTSFILGYALCCLIDPYTLLLEQRNVLKSSTFPNICESLDFLPTLSNWTVDRWLSIVDEQQRWWEISDVFKFVGRPYLEKLKPYSFVSGGEKKYFTEFLTPNASCNVITLGVGYDVGGERKLFQRYPQCKFLALDPQEKGNREVVEQINGRFVQGAIGYRTGVYDATIRINITQRHYSNIPHIGLADFLNEHNGKQLIDLMVIDTEGAEFGLLQALHEDAEAMPTICQFNMELHYPPSNYNSTMPEFTAVFSRLLKGGRYMLLNADRLDVFKFHRFYFLNIKDQVCIEKFLCRS